jgi:DNA-binding CsgD family transcriptional regulator
MLSLTGSELRRITALQRTLLSLTDAPDLSAWAQAVAEGCRPLFGTDHVYYLQPAGPAAPNGTSPTTESPAPTPARPGAPVTVEDGQRPDDTALQVYCPSSDVVGAGIRRHFLGFDEGFSRFTEAYPTQQHRLVRLSGPGAYHDAPLHDGSVRRGLEIYQDAFRPVGIDRQMAISVPLPLGEAMLLFGYERAEVPDYEGSRHRLLELLAPALEAGLRVRRRLEGLRSGVGAALDQLPVALLVFDADGTEVHRSRAFRRVAAPAAAAVLAARARRLAGGLCGPVSGDGLPTVQATVTVGPRTYTLRAFRDASDLPRPGVMVLVEPEEVLPTAAALAAGSALTPREAEVALLIAEGRTDQEIADRLFISVYTARNHTARVLDKLDVPGRAAVGLALLRLPY